MAGLKAPDLSGTQKTKVAALGALYSLYKKAKGAGRPLGPASERTHAGGNGLDWNESYYFNFTDRAAGIGGYTRIGILPNQESDIGALMILAGGKRLLVASESGRVAIGADRLSIGSLAYESVEPLRRWRLTFDGEMGDLEDSRMLTLADMAPEKREKVSLDLGFEGLAPCFNFKNADPRALAEMLAVAGTRLADVRSISRVSSEHYEQSGRVSGTIRIGEREVSFSGGGHRDHSWGVRDWSAPRLWTWLTCQFGDELAFNLSRVAIKSVDVFNGFVTRGGANYPIRRAELKTEFEEDGVTQRVVELAIEDTGGKLIRVSGDVLAVIPLDLSARGHATLVNEGLAEYTWEGRKAFGIAEYLHQTG